MELNAAGKSLKGWQAGTSMAGTGRPLIPPPGASGWVSLALVAAGLAIVPVWGKGLRPGVRAAARASD